MTRKMTDYEWLASYMPLTELITGIVTLSDTFTQKQSVLFFLFIFHPGNAGRSVLHY